MDNESTWTTAQSEYLILEVRKFSWRTVYDRALHDELRAEDSRVPSWETFIAALSRQSAAVVGDAGLIRGRSVFRLASTRPDPTRNTSAIRAGRTHSA